MTNEQIADENIYHFLCELAGFEPSDIEDDDFEIGVNDDQFATMSIVETAGLARDLIAKQKKQIEQLQLDSDRWHAFINSPFRLFGYAGLGHEDATQPCPKTGKNGYAHFGCEMWTKHSGWKHGAGKDILIGYADQAITANKLAKEQGDSDE